MFARHQLHRVLGVLGVAFHRGTTTHCSTRAATEPAGHTLIPSVASKTWLESGHQQPYLESSPYDTSSRSEESGIGSELGVDWGRLNVLGRNGRRCVY